MKYLDEYRDADLAHQFAGDTGGELILLKTIDIKTHLFCKKHDIADTATDIAGIFSFCTVLLQFF